MELRVASSAAILFSFVSCSSAFAIDRNSPAEGTGEACSSLCEQWMSMGREGSPDGKPSSNENFASSPIQSDSKAQNPSTTIGDRIAIRRTKDKLRVRSVTGTQRLKDNVPLPPRRDQEVLADRSSALVTPTKVQQPFKLAVTPALPTALVVPSLQNDPPGTSMPAQSEAKTPAALDAISLTSTAIIARSLVPAAIDLVPPVLERTSSATRTALLTGATANQPVKMVTVSRLSMTNDQEPLREAALYVNSETPVSVRLVFYFLLACFIVLLMRRTPRSPDLVLSGYG